MSTGSVGTVVVTGAAGGIGGETVPLLRARGFDLLLIDRDAEGLQRLVGGLADGPGTVAYVASAIDGPQSCADALAHAPGPLFALVHLAGVFIAHDLTPESRAVWDDTAAANLTNAYDMAVACAPRLTAAPPGRMVFVSSLAFRRGSPLHVAYAAAKGGLVGMTRALARRLAPDVLVNALAPGLIDTPMPRELLRRRGPSALDEIPLKRLGHPREVAAVIDFLCSDGATYITGQTINVDGGIING